MDEKHVDSIISIARISQQVHSMLISIGIVCNISYIIKYISRSWCVACKQILIVPRVSAVLLLPFVSHVWCPAPPPRNHIAGSSFDRSGRRRRGVPYWGGADVRMSIIPFRPRTHLFVELDGVRSIGIKSRTGKVASIG